MNRHLASVGFPRGKSKSDDGTVPKSASRHCHRPTIRSPSPPLEERAGVWTLSAALGPPLIALIDFLYPRRRRHNSSAQGNALGTRPSHTIPALKGRNPAVNAPIPRTDSIPHIPFVKRNLVPLEEGDLRLWRVSTR